MTRRLNQFGFDHVALSALFVVMFAVIGSYYLIVSHAQPVYEQVRAYSSTSNTCLANYGDSSTSGTTVVVWGCKGNPGGSLWTRNGNLIQSNTGLCIDDWGDSKTPGTQVRLYACNTNDKAQIWELNAHDQLWNPSSGLCLDDAGGSSTNGTKVDVYTCKTSSMANQQWAFVTTSGTASQNCWSSVVGGNLCYYWVQAQQNNNGNFSAVGASAQMYQPNPKIPISGHSVYELWLGTSANAYQAVEIGWYKDQSLATPELFATAWVNGNFIGYANMESGTGFVNTNSFTAGSKVAVGKVGSYEIYFADNQWRFYYNGTEFGYFPESVWTSRGASFTSISRASPYGEVEDNLGQASTIQMGNGVLGSNSGSGWISDWQLYKSTTPAKLVDFLGPSGTAAQHYDYGNTSASAFQLGGPGW